MKKLFLLISFVLLSTQAFGAPLLNPPEAYQPEHFQAAEPIFIEKIAFIGSGCSLEDKGELFDTNNDGFPDQFRVLLSKFIPQQGPGVPISERRKNCNVVVQLHLPQGFRYSIAKVQYNGYADLPTGVWGQQESTIAFPSFNSATVTLRTNIRGPFAGNYDRIDTLELASLVWSPCGVSAPLNIRTQIALLGNITLPAYIGPNDPLGYTQQIYGLQWRQCNP